MAERTLKKLKPDSLPCVLLRPAIIGAAYREPFLGWTDTLSAAGGLGLAGGVGIINYVKVVPEQVIDLIPVDYVTNLTLISTAFQSRKPGLSVVHSCSSSINPCTARVFMEGGFEYLKHQPLEQQIAPISITFIKDKKMFDAAYYFHKELPIKILDKVSKHYHPFRLFLGLTHYYRSPLLVIPIAIYDSYVYQIGLEH